MVLRTGTPGDVAAMYALDLLCFEAPFTFDHKTMRRLATAPNSIVILAEEADGLAGFVLLNPRRTRAYVSTLDVAPAFRRQGVARVLMVAAEDRALAAGLDEMTLHVFAGNTAAIRFYENTGYVQAGAEPDFYGPALNAWVYRKRLV